MKDSRQFRHSFIYKFLIIPLVSRYHGVALIILPISENIPAIIGLVILGLGCAPIYPCIIHSTPANFGADNSGAIIGIQMASAYVGSTFMPPLFGLIANHTTLLLMPFYIAVFLILMILMLELCYKKVDR